MTSRILTVARREVRGYFDQPTAYVLIVAFLGLSLFLAFRTMLASSIASLRPLFDLLPILFAIFVPAATMRSLAEERRNHTLEWLLAQPITEAEMLVGKFLGDWAFVMIALAGTLPTAAGILLASQADPGIVLAQYVGAALLAAQFVAIGLWASSITRNQITAFIVAASLSFALFLIGVPLVQIGLPPVIGGALARLSVLSHFENVARGVVDLRDVLYFASTTALFLVLALTALGRERLSHARAEYKRLRVGAGVVALLVVVLNLLGSHVRGRLDLTADNLYTLSPGTREILGELDDLVQIKLYASSELPPEIQLQLRDVRDLLSDMRRASGGNLVVTDVDPSEDEDAASEASSFGVSPVEFNVLRDDEFQVRRGYYGLAVIYADQHEVTPIIQRTDDLEFQLASQIYGLTTDERPGVAFMSGFGAKGLAEIPGLQQSLAERYDVRTIDIAGDSAPAISRDSTEVLVVAGPTQPLDSMAVRRVRDFIGAGGAALLLLEPAMLNPQSPMAIPVRSGLEPVLADAGLEFTTQLVVDLASSERVSLGRQGLFNVIAPYPLWPIARPASDHPITRGLNSVTLAWAAGFEVTDGSAGVTPLWQTTEAGGVHPMGGTILPDQEWNRPDEELGVHTLAVALSPSDPEAGGAGDEGEGGDRDGEDAGNERGAADAGDERGAADAGDGETPSAAGPRGRMVVVGDATFVEPQFIQSNPGNAIFLANAIDWLAQDEALMSIRAKDRTPPPLVFESDAGSNVLKWGNLVGVPLLFALFGVVRVTGRRRRAQARWGEVVA